ncbi:family 43 glycosylhydrolase [Vibrio sp. WXL210]|uniref:family 43 glycosylhydrolase n=1 Tax=Vibrio sp. WXL210 TaxID=3450709 RepID=UPI003EC62B2E
MKISTSVVGTLALPIFLIGCSQSNAVSQSSTANLVVEDASDISINVGDKLDFGYEGDILLPKQGVNDPHIHIFEGKAYLFASHDKEPGETPHTEYTMDYWNVFSSEDLVNWDLEFILDPKDTYIGETTKAFAIDAAERNGNYYIYFSNFNIDTGVAMSTDGPGGPYKDVLGGPLLKKEMSWNKQYDPTIFIDDDNTPYIIFGYTGFGTSYRYAELNDDMISLASGIQGIEMVDEEDTLQGDASYLHKHRDTYYLNTHKGRYASSDSFKGPYKFRGALEAHGDHGTFFTWNNQTYYTFGIWEGPFHRSTMITYAHYKDDGEIVATRSIGEPALGVGRYDANWERVEAEWFFAASETPDKRDIDSGFEMRGMQNNAYLFYPRVRNLQDKSAIQLHISSNNSSDVTVEVRKDSTQGGLLGSCEIPKTASWTDYQTVDCALNKTDDIENLYLVFKGDERNNSELARLDWFSFK